MRKGINYEKINTHPVLKDEFRKCFPEDQLYSVEQNLETLIPWIQYVESMDKKNIFVFGTGSGGTTVACALQVGDGKITGVDINKNEIEKTKIRADAYGVSDKINLEHLESTYPLPYDDESFEIAVLSSVIEHIVDERGKYIKDIMRVIKRNGLLVISGTPNLLYPKDIHTTNLYFIPWMPRKFAYKYAVWRKRWKEGENLEYAGRKGITYRQLVKWLKGFSFEILNLKPGFTCKYLRKSERINTLKRKIMFYPYLISEYILAFVFNLPVTAVMPYLNHLIIRKK